MSSRHILCEKCGELKPMHPEDIGAGFKRRRVVLRAKKPEDHAIVIHSDSALPRREELASLICDNCGNPIKDGEMVVAETLYRGEEPRAWEDDYKQ